MEYVSEISGIRYEAESLVFFRNLYQSAWYASHGAKIRDVFCDGSGKLVFCFDRSAHNKLISLWNANKDKR